MNRSMITSAVTMSQLQKRLDTTANNLANVDTSGYKRRETNFSALLSQQFDNQPIQKFEQGRKTPLGIRQGNGAKVSETNLILDQGSLKETGRELDLALAKKDQFFKVLVNTNGQESIQYTRDGTFYLSPNPEGDMQLVTSGGHRILSETGEPISIPEQFKSLTVNESGEVIVTYDDNFSESIDTIQLSQVIRPQLLKASGDNLFAFPNLNELNIPQEGVVRDINFEEGSIKQGYLEASNVDMSKEMTDLMVTQKAYQFNAKSLTISERMMELVNGLR